jgi:hypothetical protein
VWVANPTSSAGARTYGHWFVVLGRPQSFKAGAEFWPASPPDMTATSIRRGWCACPTTSAIKSGHPRTGLTAPSAVHVEFTHTLVLEQVPGKPTLQVECELRPLMSGARRTVTASELQAILATFRSYWLARWAEDEQGLSLEGDR